MDWKLLGSTFVMVFLAELGDKTQLATLVLAADAKSKVSVFLGAAAALVSTSALAAVAGGAVARVIPVALLPRLAGGLFVLLGAWMLLARGPQN